MTKYDFLPLGADGFLNSRNPELDPDDNFYVESDESKELRKELKRSNFHILEHSSFKNKNIHKHSLVFFKSIEKEMIICDVVNSSRMILNNVAIPIKDVKGILVLDRESLYSVKKKNIYNGIEEKDRAYFENFVKDYIMDQGTYELWQANKVKKD